MLLVLGFFTCGFQLAFITVHMPSYLVDRGLSAQVGGWTLATIGLFNIVGSVTSGWLGDRMPKRYLLSFIYFVRAAAILAFISFPVTPFTCIAFGATMGLMWLSTVPPTNGIIAVMFGTRWLATLVGLRLLQPPGRRLPRRLARRHRVRPHRFLRSGVVAGDPVRRAVGADQYADRREAGAARGRRAGLTGHAGRHVRRECGMATFKAIVIDKADAGQTVRLTDFDDKDLMDGDVTVRVEYSTVNYKDGLAVTGKAPVVRRFPMIAGVDFAGTVESSSHPGLEGRATRSSSTAGASARPISAPMREKARVKGDWLVRLPAEHERARRHGDRHRRLYRDAGGDGAGARRA